MWLEIVGAVALWVFGTIAIGEWFALQKLNARYDRLLRRHKALQADHKRMLYLTGESVEK
jgi:hypothetical protein